MQFEIVGSRQHIRLDEEMALVDKKGADAAFKGCKKELLDPYMKGRGFLKYKAGAYVRRNRIDLLEYVDLQKERYGSKTFTVNLAVMPLYIPHQFLVFGFSTRLGQLICGRDTWWDFADGAICEKSMKNVRDGLDLFAMPWFGQLEDEAYVTAQLMEQKRAEEISVYNEAWLDAIDSRAACGAVVQENIEKLKLPRRL